MENEDKSLSADTLHPDEVERQMREAEPTFKLDCRAKIATWIAYAMMYGKCYGVSHDNDLPWDCSGSLIRFDDSYDQDSYESVEEFLEEPSGESTPTYASGCGMNHETLGDKLYDMLRDHAYEWAYSFLPPIPEEGHHDAFWDLDRERGEPVGDLLAMLPCELVEESHKWSLSELLDEGEEAALQQKKQEEIAQEERRIQQAQRRQLAIAVFSDFVRNYQLRIGEFPERPAFTRNDPSWPAIKALFVDMSVEDRSLLSDVFPGSNSIKEYLTGWRKS